MEYLAFGRREDGCYGSEMLCVGGVHVLHTIHYCHHNNDYGDGFSVFAGCDGSCRKPYRPDADDDEARPPKMVAVPDRVMAELVEPFLATGEKREFMIPRPGREMSDE